MVGSTAAVIAIPIVTTISVAIWLILVFYADRHPQWHANDSSRVPDPSSETGWQAAIRQAAGSGCNRID